MVEKKDEVKTGQLIGKADGMFSSNIHSSVTGVVKAVGKFPHPTGNRVLMVHIKRTQDDEWDLLPKIPDWKNAANKDLEKLLFDAGIVGMGGALFPTHIKLNVPKDKTVDAFILNGCECEPYLTCDHRIMIEWTDKLLEGMAIKLKILGIEKGYIAIEDNKPDAIAIMQERVKAGGYNYEVCVLPVKYPQGAEKMLIRAILRREVPTGGLPSDVGVIVNNVSTAVAVAEAVIEGKPLISRVVTVTGDSIANPGNIVARVGSTFQHAIDFCGGFKEEVSQVFMGGPMMGFAQFRLDVPIVKGASGIVARSQNSEQKTKTYPCISCNSCVRACPMFLMPNRLSRFSEMDKIEEAEQIGIMNCINCGSCVFSCPSHIPILQWIQVGKFKVVSKHKKATA